MAFMQDELEQPREGREFKAEKPSSAKGTGLANGIYGWSRRSKGRGVYGGGRIPGGPQASDSSGLPFLQ